MALDTGRKITRRSWDVIPTPAEDPSATDDSYGIELCQVIELLPTEGRSICRHQPKNDHVWREIGL